MNRVDGIILGVGIVVLAASIIGVILYEDPAETGFQVTFAESSEQSLAEQSNDGAAGEYTFEVPVNASGLASTIFTVDASRNGAVITDDSVEVTAQGPNGTTADCTFTMTAGASASGTCVAEASVSEMPDGSVIDAEDAETAEAEARETLGTAGTGTWTVTVTITAGTGAPGPGAPSYQVSVTPAYTVWQPSAQVTGPGAAGP